jgi:peroxidase
MGTVIELDLISGQYLAALGSRHHGLRERSFEQREEDASAMVKNYSVDGSGNVASNPTLNATGTSYTHKAPLHFGPDGGLADGPNPREISNVLVAGNGTLAGPPFSGHTYIWGQFLAHEFDLTNPDQKTDISISVPDGDPIFQPGAKILVTRAIRGPDGGIANGDTGWIDASVIYGSDEKTRALVRGEHGKLATSDGKNLPVVPVPAASADLSGAGNTTMVDPRQTESTTMVAGDPRAAENPVLSSMHTLWVREHNTWADYFAERNPEWDGDKVFNAARAVVTAEYQRITFEEFLPLVVGKDHVTAYSGYNPDVDPRINLEFAIAAFRFGHSIVSEELVAIDNKGEPTGKQDLADAFGISPEKFRQLGADGLLRHGAADVSQKFDIHIVESLRSFLNVAPFGTDLAASNIQRARDVGLGHLNDVREAYGLPRYTSFDQISSDPDTVTNLEKIYGSVDSIDLWTGGLSEDAAPGALVGSTFQKIIADQFLALRDGDPKWYESQDFDPKIRDVIDHTTLSQVIVRNTDTSMIQDNAFRFADRHASDTPPEKDDAPQLVMGIDDDEAEIVGRSEDDTLVAGLGKKQIMTGLDGGDKFVFLKSGHDVTITDFTPGEDIIDFELTAGDFSSVEMTSMDDGSTLISMDDNTIRLAGVSSDELSSHDFMYNKIYSSVLPLPSM